jgi:hypothetical protein
MWTGFNSDSAKFTSSEPNSVLLPPCGGDKIYIGLQQYSTPSSFHDSDLSFIGDDNLLVSGGEEVSKCDNLIPTLEGECLPVCQS